MNAIAAEVGLHKTSLYHHIVSKQDLLVSLVRTVLQEPIADLEKIAGDSSRSPNERLYDAVFYIVKSFTSSTDTVAAFDLYSHEIEDPAVRRSVVQQQRHYIGIFVSLVQECLQGSDTNEDPAIVAYGILGMCSYILNWYKSGRGIPANQLAESFGRAALRSVDHGALRRFASGPSSGGEEP